MDHVTFLTDLKIVCLTVKNVVKREGIEFKKGNQQIMDYFKEHDNC